MYIFFFVNIEFEQIPIINDRILLYRMISQGKPSQKTPGLILWPCQQNLIKTFQNEANTPLITKITLKTFLNILIQIWGSDKHHNIFRIIILYSSFFWNSKLFFNVKMNRHFWQGWMLVTENKERSLSNRFRACLHIIIITDYGHPINA